MSPVVRGRLQAAALLAAASGLLVAYAWPGLMSWDSVIQLYHARYGLYGDWHPPLMGRVWRALDAIVTGPPLMLLLQVALFAIGLYAIFRRYAAPGRAGVVAAVVLLTPPVFAPLAVIWKDNLMAGLLLCAAAGLPARARTAQVAGWLALIAVGALRHNAPIAIVPLAAMVCPFAPHWPAWRRHALGAALGVAVGLAGAGLSHALTRTAEYPFATMIAMPDTAAVIARADAMSDADARAMLDGVSLAVTAEIQPRLRALGDFDWFTLSNGEHRVFEPIKTEDQGRAMVHAWRRAIASNPGSYLAHRARLLAHVLGWSQRRPAPFFTPRDEDPHHLAQVGEHRSYARWQLAVGKTLTRIGRSIVFWPTLYLVLALGLLALLWRDPLQRGLLVGALGYELSMFFLSPGSDDYRYSHWLITCAVIASAVRLLGARRAAAAPATG